MDRMLHDRKFCSVNFAFKSFASNTALGEFSRKTGRWIEQSHRIASSEGTSHKRIFYRSAIFYIFRSNERSPRFSLSIEINILFPRDHTLNMFREIIGSLFIGWDIYFISKFLPDVRQHGVQHVALRNAIQENVISQLSVCIN